jgi:exopolysaccharide biosynthesis operon protein EpsL
LLYDSNFLRLSDTAKIPGKSDKSEFVKQAKAGVDLDWKISRQHILITANVNQNWFQNFTSLDYTGWDTKAQWNWKVRSDLDGDIGYSNTQALGSFVQLNGLFPNLQNNQRYFANAGYLFHPNGKIKFGLFRTEFQYDDNSRKASNNTENNADLNLQYLSPTGSILGLQLLATEGQYPHRQLTPDSGQDDAYNRMKYALNWDWHANSKTRIDGLVGYLQQNYTHLSALDFADGIGELNLNWQASDKTLLGLSARREIYMANNQFSSFMLTQGVWFSPTWQASPKIVLKLPISYQQQQYLGGIGTTDNFGHQKDNVSNIGFNLMYYPWESISVGGILKYEKRDSNNSQASYETGSAGVNFHADF